MTRPCVLVLEDCRQTLAVVRSLGHAGCHVVLGRTGAPSYAEYSRWCAEVWPHPSFTETRHLEQALGSFLGGRPDIGGIFPTGDTSNEALSRMASIHAQDVDIVGVEPKILRICLDKLEANSVARDSGLTTPATAGVKNLEELRAFAKTVGYPLIVKPAHPVKRVFDQKAVVVENSAALQALFSAWPNGHASFVIQKYIVGTIEAFDFVAHHGRIVAYFEYRARRTDSLDGTGLVVDFVSTQVTPDLMASGKRFIRALNYSGPGLMQFVRDAEGQLYFLENNPRLSAGIVHPIACGVNSPILAMQATCRKTPMHLPELDESQTGYRVGVRAHWLEGDIEGLLRERKNLSLLALLRWVSAMLTAFLFARCHTTWQWNDPVPSIMLHLQLLSRVKKIFRPSSSSRR